MTDLPEKTLIRPNEAAPFLGVSLSTVYRWCDCGELKAIKIRGTRRILRESILKHISDGNDE